MNVRRPSFISEDESKKKNILNTLDIYTEEELMNVFFFSLYFNFIIKIAVKILQKQKSQRSATDIKILMKCTEKVSFFAEMINNQESEKHEECCKNMGYKFGEKGETVVIEGTVGQIFYIILKGVVGIYKADIGNNPIPPNKDPQDSSKLFIKKTPMTLKQPSSTLRRLSNLKLKKESTQEFTKIESNFSPDHNLFKIKNLKAGESFGELSLLDNKPRAATVICEQECHLAILEKQYFDKILS